MPEIRVRFTTFNPEEDPAARINWTPIINRAVARAVQLYRPHGYQVVISSVYNLDVPGSRWLLAYNWWESAAGAPPGDPHVRPGAVREYRENIRLGRIAHTAYVLDAATVVASRVGQGRASAEAIRILGVNRVPGEVSTYWVPDIDHPNAAGHTICRPFYTNIQRNREGIFIRSGAGNTTLAHEIGHLLMRTGHCQRPISHAHLPACACAESNNLMFGDGDADSRTQLTEEQLERMETEGATSHFWHRH